MARKRDQAAFEARKAEIRDVAEALFAERGFHQTGMAAICAAAGMSPGALYRYFPSKTEIIRAIVDKDRVDSVAILDPLARADDLRAASVELLEAALIEMADPLYARLSMEILAEGHRDPAIGAMLERTQEDLVAHMTTILDAARADGRVGEDVDSEAAARVLTALLDGAMADGPALAGLPKPRLRAVLTRIVNGLFG